MTWSDANALFELAGAALAWGNTCKLALSEGPPAGVAWSMLAFSAVWAAVGVFYYLGHGECLAAWAAFVRGLALVAWCAIAARRMRQSR